MKQDKESIPQCANWGEKKACYFFFFCAQAADITELKH